MESPEDIMEAIQARVGGILLPPQLFVGRCTLQMIEILHGHMWLFLLDGREVRGYATDEDIEDMFATFVSNPEPWFVLIKNWGYFREKMSRKETFIEGFSQYVYGVHRHRMTGLIPFGWIKQRARCHGVSLKELIDIRNRISMVARAAEELRK